MQERHGVILTGGLGFLGSSISQVLCDAGYNVVIVDNKDRPVDLNQNLNYYFV